MEQAMEKLGLKIKFQNSHLNDLLNVTSVCSNLQ
jgi:hypothetical protein